MSVRILKPATVVLDTSRVGVQLDHFNQIRVGETVTFTYDGGTDERGHRTVLVTDIKEGDIVGPTLERGGEFRRYKDYHASKAKVVTPFVVEDEPEAPQTETFRTRFDEAWEKLKISLSGTQLAELYSQFVVTDAESVTFDDVAGEVVVVKPVPQPEFVVHHGALGIVKPNGDRLNIYVNSDNHSVGLSIVNYDAVHLSESNVTPQRLLEVLTRHLS